MMQQQMRRACRCALILAVGLVLLGLRPAAAEELISFRKLHLTDKFYSEGATFADLDNDGHNDVISGPYWYAGPEFQRRGTIYPPEPFPAAGYSKNFSMFAEDFNGDGWTDVFVVGFPGEESTWWENPGPSPSAAWVRHVVVEVTDNESPVLGDLTGDGRLELLFQTQNQYGYATPDPQQPTKLWQFHPVSDRIAGGKFEHGLGYGDVNGDGRIDLVTRQGWLEHPAADAAGPWTMHPHNFADAASHMQVYDFDGDGDNDIACSWHCHQWGLVWHEQLKNDQGETTFRRHDITGREPGDTPYGLTFTQAHAVAAIDIDGDRISDLVTGKRYWAHNGNDPGGNDPALLYWFQTVRRGPGDVDFVPHLIDSDSGVGTQVTVGNLDRDQLPDIVVGNKKGTFVFLQERRQVTREQWLQAQPQRRQ